jgi:hypothetical protein
MKETIELLMIIGITAAIIVAAMVFYFIVALVFTVFKDFKEDMRRKKELVENPDGHLAEALVETYVGPQADCKHCGGNGYITIMQNNEEAEELCGCVYRQKSPEELAASRASWLKEIDKKVKETAHGK